MCKIKQAMPNPAAADQPLLACQLAQILMASVTQSQADYMLPIRPPDPLNHTGLRASPIGRMAALSVHTGLAVLQSSM